MFKLGTDKYEKPANRHRSCSLSAGSESTHRSAIPCKDTSKHRSVRAAVNGSLSHSSRKRIKRNAMAHVSGSAEVKPSTINTSYKQVRRELGEDDAPLT